MRFGKPGQAIQVQIKLQVRTLNKFVSDEDSSYFVLQWKKLIIAEKTQKTVVLIRSFLPEFREEKVKVRNRSCTYSVKRGE